MNCRNCGKALVTAKGEPMLGALCAACQSTGSRDELLALQRQFLPAVMADDYPLFKLCQRRGRAEWHIEFIGPYHSQAMCGVVIEPGRKGRSEWRSRRLEYSKLDAEPNLCSPCRAVLEEEKAAMLRSVK